MTDQRTLACQAEQIQCWLPTRGQQMAVLIAIFGQLSGLPMTCESLQALAEQWACIPRDLQLAALIGLAVTMQPNTGQIQVFQGTGDPTTQAPVIATPNIAPAIYIDVTTPTQVAIWNWNGQIWNEFIAA